jgi:putative sugar O-methyltransferase
MSTTTRVGLQVQDDPALLDLMLEDLHEGPELYQPGNYWANYEKLLVPELRTTGLRDFRRRRASIVNTFGAADFDPITAELNAHPANPESSGRLRVKRLILELARRVRPASRALRALGASYVGASLEGVQQLCYVYAAAYGRSHGARPLEDFSASTAGNPEDVFVVDGRTYTTSMLQSYILYAYCCRFLSFDTIQSVMELGSGSGKQVEVIRKLHPQLSYFLFDIPPQLYVCEQYLRAVFPDSVVSYRETRTFRGLGRPQPGKIYMFGTAKLAELDDLRWDLFWNAASFQEMEPDLVLNYLGFVNRQTGRHVFLEENMHGMHQASRPGEHGVLQRTTMEHYRRGLPDFDLVDLREAIDLQRLRTSSKSLYSFSFWNRTESPDEGGSAGTRRGTSFAQ